MIFLREQIYHFFEAFPRPPLTLRPPDSPECNSKVPVLQCVAVCCSVLQCVAVCCSVLQCAAVCCSVLQCAAVC